VIDRLTFTGGLAIMALQLNKPAEQALLDAYHLGLASETDSQEWGAFFPVAVKRFGWKFLPTVPELLDALREFRGQPSLDAEAVAAYERVIEAGVYNAEGGTSWSFRSVLDGCGKAAAEAFLEAGGHNAFASTFRESDRRERFIAAYREVSRCDESARLLPPGPVKALPPAEEPFRREEAAAILEKVSGLHSGEETPKFTKPPMIVEATEERIARLTAQALGSAEKHFK
jgi:hypothetical protein